MRTGWLPTHTSAVTAGRWLAKMCHQRAAVWAETVQQATRASVTQHAPQLAVLFRQAAPPEAARPHPLALSECVSACSLLNTQTPQAALPEAAHTHPGLLRIHLLLPGLRPQRGQPQRAGEWLGGWVVGSWVVGSWVGEGGWVDGSDERAVEEANGRTAAAQAGPWTRWAHVCSSRSACTWVAVPGWPHWLPIDLCCALLLTSAAAGPAAGCGGSTGTCAAPHRH